jgi:hypothetical protein
MTQPRKLGWLAAIACVAGLAAGGSESARADFDFQYYANPEIFVATTPGTADIATKIGAGADTPGSSTYIYTAADGSKTKIEFQGQSSGSTPLDASSSQDLRFVNIAINSNDANTEFNLVFGVDLTLVDPTPGSNPNDQATFRITGMLSGKNGSWSFRSFTPGVADGSTLAIGDVQLKTTLLGGSFGFGGGKGTRGLGFNGSLVARVAGLTPVPEPNTLALFGVGGAGIVFACRARRKLRVA